MLAENVEKHLQEYRRTCQNCRFWVPPEHKNGRLVKDSRCGHPGGWTAIWIGPPEIYQKMECREFTRRE